MECKRDDISKLLKKLETEVKLDLVHSNFVQIQELLKAKHEKRFPGQSFSLSAEYIYRKLHLPVKRNNAIIKLNVAILNNISRAIGYDSYKHFADANDAAAHPSINRSIGNWYNYVRCNSGQEYVLRAPVRIFEEKKEVFMEMKGPLRTFRGHVQVVGECFHCHLQSTMNKNIHLVLKTGIVEKPQVLQGVFSGLSAAGDPIAGREILIRQNAEFEALTNERIAISTLINSDETENKRVGKYFSDQARNIIKGGRASTFGLDDLVLE